MNDKAAKLNLENTHFVTPHGLDNDEHYTTAYETCPSFKLCTKKIKILHKLWEQRVIL